MRHARTRARKEEGFLQRLVDALRLAASDYETQVRALPPDQVCTADEIAITYGDSFLLAGQILSAGLITQRQYDELKALDGFFSAMSGQEHAELWTLDALREGAEWMEVRTRARKLLDVLGVAHAPPDLSWIVFVPSRPGDPDDATRGIEFDEP